MYARVLPPRTNNGVYCITEPVYDTPSRVKSEDCITPPHLLSVPIDQIPNLLFSVTFKFCASSSCVLMPCATTVLASISEVVSFPSAVTRAVSSPLLFCTLNLSAVTVTILLSMSIPVASNACLSTMSARFSVHSVIVAPTSSFGWAILMSYTVASQYDDDDVGALPLVAALHRQ